jgi:uncharacterized protein with WD repeat
MVKQEQSHTPAEGSGVLRKTWKTIPRPQVSSPALKWAVSEKFREYLLGSKFVLYTNNPLTYIQSKCKLKAIEQRWAAELANFDFSISTAGIMLMRMP